MSYLVLARKYRPRRFAQVVGQESVLRVLTNALLQNRLHHAYLFTGTRGVGKTSLARLFAKSLNCENRIEAEPCEQCQACLAIDAGRFVDLVEIDAASRTKVEDMRVLLDNVQYAPVLGRYKIYLIDEVHMLSLHSFNALLKTLEEPPPRIVFLLATTDPQRLPETVLSRCLQFHLKNLTPEQITHYLSIVSAQEQVSYELSALQALALAAQGSLRDALSLLDQAIAYGQRQVKAEDVKALLGSVSELEHFPLLEALIKQDPKALMQTVSQLAAQAVDFTMVLEALISTLHCIAIEQIMPGTVSENQAKFAEFAKCLASEEVQLYYQIALLGRRDLPLAPVAKMGFEMLMLRMLAFKPADSPMPCSTSELACSPTTAPCGTLDLPEKQHLGKLNAAEIARDDGCLGVKLDWVTVVRKLPLSGIAQALAFNCALKDYTDQHVHLLLDPSQAALHTPRQAARLTEALNQHFSSPITITITLGPADLSTPAKRNLKVYQDKIQEARQCLAEDQNVQALIQRFDATIQPDSISWKS